jgi:hypothetical protein
MSVFRSRFLKIVLVMAFFGWITYPGWFTDWYSTWPEQYAYPASMSTSHDPRWGFWFW